MRFRQAKTRASLSWAVGLAGQLVSSTLSGCLPTSRPQDAQAPHDFYKLVGQREAPCDHPIQVFPAGTRPGRPHRELANLSATCAPGTIELCERRLKERACTLGADALLLTEAESGPNPAAVPMQSYVSRNARALRWESQ